MKTLRLINLKIESFGDHMFNVLSYGFRFNASRSEFRRTVRLKEILKTYPNGIGSYTGEQVSEAVRKFAIK
jgi:hypothetical protein